MLSAADVSALWLTVRLAGTATACLMLLGMPLGWWLARTSSRWKPAIETLVALPLVLPPTVLGFYLLMLLGPQGPVGSVWRALGGAPLVFSFSGLVLGSIVYSLPFVVQPLQNAFQAVDAGLLEAAAALRAGPLDRFGAIVLPLARPGLLTAVTLGFAHVVGEFGVVLMIGGDIPGRTRVASIAIFDHVDALAYAQAYRLSAVLVIFSVAVLFALYSLRPLDRPRWAR